LCGAILPSNEGGAANWTFIQGELRFRIMGSNRAIAEALRRAADGGESTVLATVVRITGSSYGGVGARMLVRVDGSTVGLVSGGCIESDIAEHARRVNASGRAEVVRYDTLENDDAPWGLGLGCNGLIDILLEPLNATRGRSLAAMLDDALSADEPSVIATVIDVIDPDSNSPVVGAHALVIGNRLETLGEWGHGFLLADAAAMCGDALRAGRRGLVREFDTVEVALEVVNPSVRLVICGTGPDVLPLTQLGAQLGWDVSVVDHRPDTEERASRYPAARIIECPEPQMLCEEFDFTARTAAVVMSHHYERDRSYLQSLLDSETGYIGMLGPRARTERMLADLHGAPVPPSERDPRVFSPVGLDIGSDGPDSIALAIVAEISATLSARKGGHLRDRRSGMHSSTTEESPAVSAH
jgi:xanthine/CO dehydrogenase XdhC/CoxF family maturation factor